ncbi:hypothetical protein BDN70DRAFT_128042 [Pholiota conissans]|uniref:Uncharacterized protein n=1 Tax=Pholiota conissans TaxID=109636 RepID=A0A9P6CY57_9AGAR|nr:hypothetical protein BDN70DRAFT_128042 [Pholiota conissans]
MRMLHFPTTHRRSASLSRSPACSNAIFNASYLLHHRSHRCFENLHRRAYSIHVPGVSAPIPSPSLIICYQHHRFQRSPTSINSSLRPVLPSSAVYLASTCHTLSQVKDTHTRWCAAIQTASRPVCARCLIGAVVQRPARRTFALRSPIQISSVVTVVRYRTFYQQVRRRFPPKTLLNASNAPLFAHIVLSSNIVNTFIACSSHQPLHP